MSNYFLLYVIYSIIGFLLEESVFLWHNGTLKNNHFLLLWHCPMYGIGGLLIYILLESANNMVLIFFGSMLIALIIEYITSYFMEKIFLMKWWDYKRFHIKGRICLTNAINFGLLGLVVHFISPYIIDSLKLNNTTILSIITFFIIISDIAYSSIITYKITHNKVLKDNIIVKRINQKINNNISLFTSQI